MPGETLAIGEVASATGLRTSALRYYEDQGLIRPVARIGGRRRYGHDAVRRLSIISLFQQAGFTIREIRQLLGERGLDGAGWRGLAEQKLEELAIQLDQVKATKALLEAVLACGCGDPSGCELVTSSSERRLHQLDPTRSRAVAKQPST